MRAIAVFIILPLFLTLPASLSAEEFYVTLSGAGSRDGTSWANAWQWTDFQDSANWNYTKQSGRIGPGDTVYISGRFSGQTYSAPLNVYASGNPGNYITIRPGQDVGHNGVVTISGSGVGIHLYGESYIEVNGEYNGGRHIKIDTVTSHGVYGKNATGVKIKNIEITNWNSGRSKNITGIYFKGGDAGFEIAYNKIYSPGFAAGCDAIKTCCSGSNYGDSSIHDNTIYDLPDDGILAQNGVDIYNNFLDSENPTLRDYGHPDGIFNHNGVHHVRIYNNYIANFANDLLFFEGRKASNHHIKIYNNIWAFTEYHDHGWEGISIAQRDYGSLGDIYDVLIANNLFADIYGKAIELKQLFSPNGKINNIVVKNNIFVNCGSVILMGHLKAGAGTYIANVFDRNVICPGERGGIGIIWEGASRTISWLQINKSWTNYNAMPKFAFYDSYPNDETPPVRNDYHLQIADTVAKDKGLTITDFSYDKDGLLRPHGSTWDIGPFEYDLMSPRKSANSKNESLD